MSCNKCESKVNTKNYFYCVLKEQSLAKGIVHDFPPNGMCKISNLDEFKFSDKLFIKSKEKLVEIIIEENTGQNLEILKVILSDETIALMVDYATSNDENKKVEFLKNSVTVEKIVYLSTI